VKEPLPVHVCELAPDDHAYALSSWRESHKQTLRRVPWGAYKMTYGREFAALLKAPDSLVLGAYGASDELLGFLVASPGKRVDVLHWTQVKFKNKAGEYVRRRGIMTALLDAAELGDRFIYTLRARREGKRTLDDVIAERLAARGVVATFVDFQTWKE